MNKVIIGRDGASRYLVSLGTKVDPNSGQPEAWGEVIDLDQKKVLGPDYLSVWYSHGIWEEYTGDQSILPGLYAHVTRSQN